MTFLGFELSSVNMWASIPDVKVQEIITQINTLLNSQWSTLKEIQSIVGKLQWACNLVVPGRVFIRRLINITCHLSKPYHRLCINDDIKEDLRVWLTFLENYNGKTLFLPERAVMDNSIHFYSDASDKAAGAYLASSWFCVEFDDCWREYHISVREFYPIVLSTIIFGHKLANNKIVYHTDNIAVVEIINCQTTKNRHLLTLLRQFVLNCLHFNISFKSVHIPGRLNVTSDHISRLQVTSQNAHQYGLKSCPEEVPVELTPPIWKLE